jgi:hypothetical protein
VICKAGKPMVRLTALVQGRCSVPDDFDPLGTEAIAAAFEGL